MIDINDSSMVGYILQISVRFDRTKGSFENIVKALSQNFVLKNWLQMIVS